MGREDNSVVDDLVWVRRRDVRERRRYPVRRTVAFLTDVTLHLLFAFFALSLFFAAVPDGSGWAAFAVVIGAYLLASFTHRVFFQNVFRTTIGKAVVGLCLIRADTLDRASVLDLTQIWFFGFYLVLSPALSMLP